MIEDYRDPEVLRRLYVVEGLTHEQIAERLCVSPSVIGDRLRAAGIKGRKTGKAVAKKHYVGGEYLTVAEMSERSGVCEKTLENRIQRGVPYDKLLEPTNVPQKQIDIGGEYMTVSEIAQRTGLRESSIWARIRNGVKGKDLLKPKQQPGRKKWTI